MAEALYRKYRPQTFEDVVGQEHIERTLRNAIQSDKVSHAYLFTGPRGTGKTTTARLLAKALLCQSGPTPDPDGSCEDCKLIAAGEHPDVYELDAASRTGVENVREEIISRVNYAPTRGRNKVYIIDEVHMLSVAAFNALLKTLEEPPAHVVFVLCTTDPQKVPETIHSRCQRFDFRRIASEELIARLGAICELEGVQFEGDALDLIAHRAQGGMRDALTSLEQLIAFGDGSVTSAEAERLLGTLDSSDLADIVRLIGQRDAAGCFRWTSQYMETGADLAQFTKDLAEHMRDMYVMSLAGADVALELTEAGRRELESELVWFGPDRLSRMLGVLGDLISDLKTSTNQRLSFEIALTRMIRPDSDLTLESLAERVEALERGASTNTAAAIPQQNIPAPATQPANVTDASVNTEDGSPESGAAFPNSAQADGATGGYQASNAATAAAAQAAEHSATQPAAQPAAVPTAAPSGSDMRSTWNSVLTNLKKIAEPYGVIFMNTKAYMQGSDKLVIEFDPGNEFAFNASKKPEIRQALSDSLAAVGLGGIAFDIIKGSGNAQPKTPVAQTPSIPMEQPSAGPSGTAQPHQPEQAAVQQTEPEQYAQPERTHAPVTDSPDPAQQTPTQAQAPSGSTVAAQASAGHPADGAVSPESAPSVTPEASAAPDCSPASKNEGSEDISGVLQSVFGDGVVFEEVD